jgi:hypothetical protein
MLMRVPDREGEEVKEESSFSEEKEAKRLLSYGRKRSSRARPPRSAFKSLFASFSSEKKNPYASGCLQNPLG